MLRKSASDIYGRCPGKETYKPFVSDGIKELPLGSPVVHGADVWPPEVTEMFSDQSKCLRTLTEEEEKEYDELCRRYSHLGGELAEWIKYQHRADVDGYYHYARKQDVDPKYRIAPVAVLCVGRAKDGKLRKLKAMCPGNLLFKTLMEMFGHLVDFQSLLGLGMLGGALLGRAFAPNDIGCWSTADACQAFNSVLLPMAMWFLQACPTIKARDVPKKHQQPHWDPDDDVTPFYKRLAMGGIHSVWLLVVILLRIIRRVLSTVPSLQSFSVLNLRDIRLGGHALLLSKGVVYLHVDDAIAGHEKQAEADRCIKHLRDAFVEAGFVIDTTVGGEVEKMVGICPMRTPATLRPPLRRLGDLSRALQFLEGSVMVHSPAVHTVLSTYIWFGLLWRPSLSALFYIFRFVQTYLNCTDELVPMWDCLRPGLRRMRCFLGFIYHDMGARIFPGLLAQDAAGPGEAGAKHGGFSLAIVFPTPEILGMIHDRHEAVGLSMNKHGIDDLGGSKFTRTVPRTVLPYELFQSTTPWFSLMSKCWKFPLHINEEELRAEVIWPDLLGRALNVFRLIFVDVSDNEVTCFTTAHGRSGSPALSPVLQKRAAQEAVLGSRIRSTWTSTLFEPPDIGTRLEKSDPLLGVVVRPLSVGCRLVIVFGQGGDLLACALKQQGWTATLWWPAQAGRKYDLTTARSQGHLRSLSCSGHVQAAFIVPYDHENIDNPSRLPQSPVAALHSDAVPQANLISHLNLLREAFAEARKARPQLIEGCVLHVKDERCVRQWTSGFEWTRATRVDNCCYTRSSWLKPWTLHTRGLSTHVLQTTCPSSISARTKCPLLGRPHPPLSDTFALQRRVAPCFVWADAVAQVCTTALRQLRRAHRNSSSGPPCGSAAEGDAAHAVPESAGRVHQLPALLRFKPPGRHGGRRFSD